MATEETAINVDAVDAADLPPSPRIVRGNGDAAAPLEIASSDSEDEKCEPPPAKRAKPAPLADEKAPRPRNVLLAEFEGLAKADASQAH